MGGCMTLKFLRDQTQSWKDKYVRALVSLAGVWGGAVKALKVFAVGTSEERVARTTRFQIKFGFFSSLPHRR